MRYQPDSKLVVVLLAALALSAAAGTGCHTVLGIDDTVEAACTPESRQCNGDTPQVCDAGGEWVDEPPCAVPATACSTGACVAPSCVGLESTCGAGQDGSCCESFFLSGFRFLMGRSSDGEDAFATGNPNETPEHMATVDDFYLDAYEISVGRFRRFVDQYDGTPPAEGAGAHPLIPDSGWQSAWNSELPANRVELSNQLNCGQASTWTDQPGNNENLPLNCATWYELFAFCIWDGGRIPTEAEWEFAAAGGLNNRLYPWGNSPAPDATRVGSDCGFGGDSSQCTLENIQPVGSSSAGNSTNGLSDLVGGMWEWTLDLYHVDWYQLEGNDCDNCANMSNPSTQGHTIRGGGWNSTPQDLRVVRRDSVIPEWRGLEISLRCAR